MKTALLTGASGDIGLSIAEKLVLEDYFVVAVYNKNKKPLDILNKKLNKMGKGRYLFIKKIDLSKPKNIVKAYEEIEASFKHIDLLINNAGIDLYKMLVDTSIEEWENIFKINVESAFVLSKLVLPKMVERKFGKIINISSIWGQIGGSLEVAYSASKSALIGFTKALSKEVGASNINVNCIAPGLIDTKMNDIFSKNEKQEFIEKTALNRIGKVEDVSNLVLFLSSEKSNYITGEVIAVNGGITF